ncbi:MAG: element excision factor XisH family protein [Coleofasciculus sp.]|uniref:element excision factor XisH family protein n=1 Tax=Coleofasciculus sp. TaxID=3100458 RepID=UPI003A1E5249
MPAKDIYHDTVKNALIKDDWIITNDPLTIEWGKKDLFIDLGAEKLIAVSVSAKVLFSMYLTSMENAVSAEFC